MTTAPTHWPRLVPATIGLGLGLLLLSTALASGARSISPGTMIQTKGEGGPAATGTPGYCFPAWVVVPGAPIAGQAYGIAAISSDDIWLAGGGLIEHWDGASWSVVPAPNPGLSGSAVYGIGAVSANDIWIVGDYDVVTGTVPLIEHWDGTSWNVVPSPDTGTTSNRLNSVAGISPSDVWAVGLADRQPLIEHWDGTSWRIVSSPNLTFGGWLRTVAVVSASDVWAVGMPPGAGPPSTEAAELPGVGSPQKPGQQCTNAPCATDLLIEHWDGTSWSLVPAPDPGGSVYVYLRGLEANSASDIWAAGYYLPSGTNRFRTLTMHWDGSAWTIVPSPNQGIEDNFLRGVASTSPDNVWAVGTYNDSTLQSTRTLIEHWDGSSWTIVSSPNPGTWLNQLFGVAALSASEAWAVGYWVNLEGNRAFVPFIARYDPCPPTPTPTLTPTPTDTPTQTPTASQTSAVPPTATACSISFPDVPPGSAFFDHIGCLACRGIVSGYPDGTFRPGSPVTRGQLAKIVSNSAGYVEHYGTATFADVPVGSAFHLYVERLASRGYVNGYPCGGEGEPCPGIYFRPNSNVTRGQTAKVVALALQFPPPARNRQTFEDVPPKGPGSTFWPWVEALAAEGVVQGYPCGGAGEPCNERNRPYFRTYSDVTRGQAAKIVANAFFPGCHNPVEINGSLRGVAALSTDDVWAVGYYQTPGSIPYNRPLIEHWNGTAWSLVPSADTGTPALLAAVAGDAADDVWAVGWYQTPSLPGITRALIEHWNGTQWTIVSSPDVSPLNPYLLGIAAVSADDVWAVGSCLVGGMSYTLIEHWNGAEWTVVPSPNPGSTGSSLFGVAAVSANDVWAVGDYSTRGAGGHTLIVHWNGAEWYLVPSPDVRTGSSVGLMGAAAVSANDMWVVGSYEDETYNTRTLVEHWNGTSWSVVYSPSPGTYTSWLIAVAALSANDVWAVGHYWSSPDGGQTLVAHWEGTQWTLVPSPNPGASNNLMGVATLSANDVWAVGSYQPAGSPGVFRTLIEHWNGTEWSVVPGAGSGQQ